MDKRLSIALLLTALIVAVTPILFPTPRKTPATSTTVSAQAGTSSSAAAAPLAVTNSGVVSRNQTGNTPNVPATTAPGVVVPVSEQLTAVNTAKSAYRFTSVGASPVGIGMRGYRNLATRRGEVDLHAPGRALLNFAIVANKDTTRLDRVPFPLTQS